MIDNGFAALAMEGRRLIVDSRTGGELQFQAGREGPRLVKAPGIDQAQPILLDPGHEGVDIDDGLSLVVIRWRQIDGTEGGSVVVAAEPLDQLSKRFGEDDFSDVPRVPDRACEAKGAGERFAPVWARANRPGPAPCSRLGALHPGRSPCPLPAGLLRVWPAWRNTPQHPGATSREPPKEVRM